MSLFGSLITAVSGLTAQQDAIGNVSQNIANSQTVGYKAVNTSFQDLVTQSSLNYNAPGGVLATPVYLNNVAGTLAQTQTTTNLGLSGQGFFVVKAPPGTTTTGTPSFSGTDLYTRAGDFQMNSQGYLVNSAGYYLEGYSVDPTTKTTNTASVSPIQVSQLINNPVPTSTVTLSANLPAGYATQTTGGVANDGTAANANYTSPAPITTTIYDSEGVAHTVSIQLDNLGADAAAPNAKGEVWQATISAPGLTIAPNPAVYTLDFSNGTNPAYPAGTLMSINGAAGTAGAAAAIPLGLTTSNGSTFNVSLSLGNYGSVQGVTQYADSNSQVAVQTLNQNGIPRGAYQGVSIDKNGYVTINYDNGQSLTYFQIPVAQFNAAQDLQQVTGGAFQSTTQSGSALLGVAGENGAGTIASSEVEDSNVDIATEFTKLIVAQQAYSANSKVITTANSLLTELLQVIP